MATYRYDSHVLVIGAPATISRVQRDVEIPQRKARRQAEYLAYRKELFKALCDAEESGDWDFYSDLHKEFYGVRP